MADPLSAFASLLAISTAAIKTVKSLCEATRRYKGRDKTLGRLQDELDQLAQILESLARIKTADESLFLLLEGPIARCTQVCQEFKTSMGTFIEKGKAGLLDWAKMEFRRGDINEFIATIAVYKSTISVGLGTITLQTSTISNKVLSEYMEMIQDTKYDLNLQLHRIDEKMTQLTATADNDAIIAVDLSDERAVTRQCLRICEDAKAYFQRVSTQASQLLDDSSGPDGEEQLFEGQVQMRRTLNETREKYMQASTRLLQRLALLGLDETSDEDRTKLQRDLETSRQCIEICERASKMSSEKIFRVAGASADSNSDAMVVNTLADMFVVGKVSSSNNSAILVGSMTAESLREVTAERYKSRFGVATENSSHVTEGVKDIRVASASKEGRYGFPTAAQGGNSLVTTTVLEKPTSNEVKKRTLGQNFP